MSFSDVREQEVAKKLVRNMVGSGRLAHAYVFVGPPDTGKVAMAVNTAKALNCEAGAGDPCDACRQCRFIDKGIHPDVHVLRPLKASRTISINSVRELQRGISLKPLMGIYKVAVIVEADRMMQEAANSLLKSLEEPPPGTIFILTCEDTSGLLPTVLSRCQRINFMPLSQRTIESILVDEKGLDPGQARVISRLAEGRLSAALAYCDPDEIEWRRKLLDGVSEAADVLGVFNESGRLHDHFNRYRKDIAASIKAQNEGMEEGEVAARAKGLLLQEISRVLSIYMSWFRDVLVAKVTKSDDLFTNMHRVERIRRTAVSMSTGDIIRKIEAIGEIAVKINGNINRKIALDVLLLDLHSIPEGEPCSR